MGRSADGAKGVAEGEGDAWGRNSRCRAVGTCTSAEVVSASWLGVARNEDRSWVEVR